jgi:hypothetical protein
LTYHITLDNTYDRPEITRGDDIAAITGNLYDYMPEPDVSTIADVTVPAPVNVPDTFRITHDACESGSLRLTGARLIGPVTYNTYSTVFQATPTAATFRAVITGYKVEMVERSFAKSYPSTHGETYEFNNPLATDPTQTEAMYDRYHAFASATKYQVSLRDDPAVQVADTVLLDTLEVPEGIPCTVTDIRRSFNGGIDGEYTLADALLEPYPAPEDEDDPDTTVTLADGEQAIYGTSIDSMTVDTIESYDLGDDYDEGV